MLPVSPTIMRTVLLLIVLDLSPATAAGCDCLPSLPGHATGANITVSVLGLQLDYGTSYGLLTCSAHDMDMPPFCVATTPQGAVDQSGVPAWCRKHWCYVNNNTCSSAVSSSYISDAYCQCRHISDPSPHPSREF